MTVVVLVLLAGWLVLSVANQINGPWIQFLGRPNSFTLLPRLDFFAPDPVDVDYHLAFRDLGVDGQGGPWRQIAVERDGPLRIVWSTAKRDHHAMAGAVSSLAGLQTAVAPAARDAEGLIQISIPYLFLLHRVQQEPRLPGAHERQFMVVESSGFGASRRVALGILSNPHRLV
jgi:hypothetical protein